MSNKVNGVLVKLTDVWTIRCLLITRILGNSNLKNIKCLRNFSLLGRCFYWWTNSLRGYNQPSSRYFGTVMKVRIVCYWNCCYKIFLPSFGYTFGLFWFIALYDFISFGLLNILASSFTWDTLIVETKLCPFAFIQLDILRIFSHYS